MRVALTTVLMVGKGMRRAPHLERYLKGKGWDSQVEASIGQALSMIENLRFDLILSCVKLEHSAKLQLISSLVETGSSLFFSMAVEYGC